MISKCGWSISQTRLAKRTVERSTFTKGQILTVRRLLSHAGCDRFRRRHGCPLFAQTGANPVRPHMLAFNASHTHAILTFVASGHVVVFEAATRTPVACVRTTVGAGGQRQAHAAQPTPDDSYILVSNQNGKRLDRIATDYANNTFVLDASLDLANGLTPNGVPREFAGRPDNAPIIVVPDATSTPGLRHAARRWFIRGRPEDHADRNPGRVR